MRAPMRAVLTLCFPFFLATCGGDSPTGPGDGPHATSLAVFTALPGSVPNAAPFGAAVQLLGPNAIPLKLAGKPIHVVSLTAGRVLSGSTTIATNSEGVAVFSGLTLVGPIGAVQLRFDADSLPSLTPGLLSLVAGTPTKILTLTGDSQAVEAGLRLAAAMKVKATDTAGNVAGSVALKLAIIAGSGSLDTISGISTRNVVTDSNGVATLGTWRAGSLVGTDRLKVTVAGVVGGPADTLVAQVHAGPPGRVVVYNLITVPVKVGATVNNPFVALVSDTFGNPLSGVAVTFTSGDAPDSVTFTGANGITDSTGSYTLASWRVGYKPGSYTVVATAGGAHGGEGVYVSPLPFSRVIASSPELTWPNWKGVEVGFQTLDQFGNPVSGVPMKVEIASGGGLILPIGDSSRDYGYWSAGFGGHPPVGDVVIHAYSPALPDSFAVMTIHIVAPTHILVVGQDSLTLPVLDSFVGTVQVQDSAGAPVAKVPVGLGGSATQTDSGGLAHIRIHVPGGVGTYEFETLSDWIEDTTQRARWTVHTVLGPPHQMFYTGSVDTTEVNGILARAQGVLVVDVAGNPLSGVEVHFTTQNGVIDDSIALTDSTGRAYPHNWHVDTVVGLQTATASIAGGLSQAVHAYARPGGIATLSILPGPAAEGFASDRLGLAPTIEGRDRYGNPTPGRPLAGTVLSGGGATTFTTLKLDARGRALADLFVLGPATGQQDFRVSVDSLQVDFSALVRTPSPFNIVLRGVPAQWAPAFNRAKYLWRRRITADIPDLTLTIPAGICADFQQQFSGTLDDLIIDVSIGGIDGPGGILGGATPCFIRTGSNLPLLGVMQFDDADLADLVDDGTINDVILHEMGHVLGIGSLWVLDGLSADTGTADPKYIGNNGRIGYAQIGGPDGATVPEENLGGPGTREVHWRESVMPSELMTGYLSALVNPMSRLTIQSLADLGYHVDPSTADDYTIGTAPMLAPGQRPRRIRDLVGAPRYTVDDHGKVVPLR